MKKISLILGIMTMMFASCSTDEQAIDSTSGNSESGRTVTLNASIPNSGTRVKHSLIDTYGLITDWNNEDSIDVLVNTNTRLSMTKGAANKFTTTTQDQTVAEGFNKGKTIYGVNNRYDDNITTSLNGSQLKVAVDFTGQDGTLDNLKKYDLMYGKGDPTGNITFNHKICVMRLDINSDLMKTDGITSITSLELKYAATSGYKLFATQEEYNLGAKCDSMITDADIINLDNTSITVTNGTASVYIVVPHRQELTGKLYIQLNGSTGTASKSYDLTNTISLSNKSFAMSTVQSKTISNLSRVVNIGDYLFSDGTCGALADNTGKKPIAVIFSNTTSILDIAKGWSHGYAMALNTVNSTTRVAWGPTTSNPTGKKYDTAAELIGDKDGYTHTTFINSTTYPAAYAAATTYQSTVVAPSGTSGWYLPSSGQWYDIFVNLGKMNAIGYPDEGCYLYWNGQATACITNLNAYLTPLTDGSYTSFITSDYYWSSSEYLSTLAYHAYFNSGVHLGYYNKTSTCLVRGVVAF